jgi:hypothetical protein
VADFAILNQVGFVGWEHKLTGVGQPSLKIDELTVGGTQVW